MLSIFLVLSLRLLLNYSNAKGVILLENQKLIYIQVFVDV